MTLGRAHVAFVLALALAAGGCARLFDHYDVGPTGLARADERLRRMIATDADSATLSSILGSDNALPSDPVLARMYAGVLAYHAGEFGRSAALLDSATLIIDDRITRSASRAALSIISTDKVMPYQAGATERLLLHYYAALAWLQLGSAEDAAVEARRMVVLLEGTPPENPAQRRLHAAMRHVTAALFAMAGETADADVAWRNGLALLGDSSSNARLPRPDPDSVDVYLFIDRGFVGHRAEQTISLWLPGDEVGRLRADDDTRAGTATLIAARIAAASATDPDGSFAVLNVLPPPRPQRSTPPPARAEDCRLATPVVESGDTNAVRRPTNRAGVGTGCASGSARREHGDDDYEERDEDAPYLMRIAWPVFRDYAPPLGATHVRVDSVSQAPLVRASVSSAVAEDLREDRALLVARTVARAAAKLAITRGIEDELRENHETTADLFALLGNLTAAVTEQADTRSWTLLPGAVEVMRVRMPAGARTVEVGANGHRIDVPVQAGGGSIRIEHVRLP